MTDYRQPPKDPQSTEIEELKKRIDRLERRGRKTENMVEILLNQFGSSGGVFRQSLGEKL